MGFSWPGWLTPKPWRQPVGVPEAAPLVDKAAGRSHAPATVKPDLRVPSVSAVPVHAVGEAPAPERFLRCLPIVLRHEGGLVNDPHDPGGITNLGISLRAARGFGSLADVDGDGDVDADDIVQMTPEGAAGIYRAHYWTTMRADELPPGLDLSAFDFAVNAGPRRATLLLQRAVGAKADGVIGPATLRAAREKGAALAIDRFAALRGDFYRSLPTFARFGRGWLRRTEEVRRAARDMAMG